MSDMQPTEAEREDALGVIKNINRARGKAYGFGKASRSCALLKEELASLNDCFYTQAVSMLMKYRADAVKAERERCIGRVNQLIDNGWIAASASKGVIRAYVESDDQEAHNG